MKFDGSKFVDVDINLDGNEYINCHLERCNLIYRGVGSANLSSNSIIECRVTFADAAASAIGFMSELYKGGFRDLVEATFVNIRQGIKNSPGDDDILNSGIIH